MEEDEAQSSTPQRSVVSLVVVVVDNKKTDSLGKASKARYLESKGSRPGRSGM